MKIEGKFEILYDSTKQVYYGIKISQEQVNEYINLLHKENIPYEYIDNKMKRDLGSHHITIVNTAWTNKLKNNPDFNIILDKCLGKNFIFNVHGIGFAEKNIMKGDDNINYACWFIVCDNDFFTNLHQQFSIKQDTHLTLAFKNKDVHGVNKDISTIIYSLSENKLKP